MSVRDTVKLLDPLPRQASTPVSAVDAGRGGGRRNIGRFIEDIYNADRLHSALGYMTPIEFEAAQAQAYAI